MRKKKNKRLKKFKNTLAIIGILIIAGISIYAFAVNKTARASKDELGELRTIVAEYQADEQSANYNDSRGVVKTIEDVCNEEDFDVDLAIKIAACESYLDEYFIGVNNNGTIDRGIFSINSYYYKDITNDCAFDVSCSTKVFISEVKAGRASNWYCYRKLK